MGKDLKMRKKLVYLAACTYFNKTLKCEYKEANEVNGLVYSRVSSFICFNSDCESSNKYSQCDKILK